MAAKKVIKSKRGRPQKYGSKLVQITIHLREDQNEFIDSLAEQRSKELRIEVSKADIIRQAIDSQMSKGTGGK